MTEKEFIEKWTEEIHAKIGVFPKDYCDLTTTKEIEFSDKTLKLGSEFFGRFEILNSSGKPVYMANSYEEAKFILYSFRNSSKIFIPANPDEIISANKIYENKLDGFVRAVNKDFKLLFSDTSSLLDITNKIFRKLNLQRY